MTQTNQAVARNARVASLRAFLKALKSKKIVSAYEVNKVKQKSTTTGDKYTVKVAGLSGNLDDVLPILVRAYLPEAGVKTRTSNEIKMSENVYASLNTDFKEIKTIEAVRILGKMIDICMTIPQSNDGKRTTALEHIIKSYL